MRQKHSTTKPIIKKIRFCANCGKQLSGRQRLHCSDKCRKAFGRNADKPGQTDKQNQPNVTVNSKPVNVFAVFADVLSDLDNRSLQALKTELANQANYADIGVKRLLAMPHVEDLDALLSANQALAQILWRLSDDLGEVKHGQ